MRRATFTGRSSDMHLIGFLILGAIAGWLAGKVMSGHGYGILWDIVLGVVGAFVGGFIFSLIFGVGPSGLVISFIVAFIGAVVLVALLHMIKREPIRTA
ncbi:MAG TPA: GlsB/YeaQ/YmgE family stress response membrane protein [Candidatus Limnocylindrales bacterium]|nr:GlsB/YeaQ/YmgE family stress response membrane protein [Candidatus Limnocylindrales bacterium]